MTKLQGKVALVTGAGSGIGRATAIRLSADDAKVIATDITIDVDEIDGVEFIKHDVQEEGAWEDLMASIERNHGRLDILVNNAGILREAPIEETSFEMWSSVLSTNLTGTFFGCKHAVPLLAQSEGGAIVNVSSIDALSGSFHHAAYAASKGGVAALTRAAAMELAERGIRVNAVCPGSVETPMAEAMFAASEDPELAERRREVHPLGRISTPEEQADAIVFLCGPDAAFITGAVLPVDGGRAIR